MKKNEEYVANRGRDLLLLLFGFGLLGACLLWKPEWCWVSFPFIFTSLAGVLGRL